VQTVTIGVNSYGIYGTTTARDAYLAGSYRYAAAWAAIASADTKNQISIDVARVLDRLSWKGEPSASFPDVQANAWPRDGATDGAGDAVPDGTTPTFIDWASYELSAMLLTDPDVLEEAADVLVKLVQAGSAKVEFFGPQSVGRFPKKILEWLAGYLAGSSATAAGEAFGTDGELAFDDDDAFGLSNGGL
jgi:hypothetical protein